MGNLTLGGDVKGLHLCLAISLKSTRLQSCHKLSEAIPYAQSPVLQQEPGFFHLHLSAQALPWRCPAPPSSTSLIHSEAIRERRTKLSRIKG